MSHLPVLQRPPSCRHQQTVLSTWFLPVIDSRRSDEDAAGNTQPAKPLGSSRPGDKYYNIKFRPGLLGYFVGGFFFPSFI